MKIKVLVTALFFANLSLAAISAESTLGQIRLNDPRDVSSRANQDVNYGGAGVSTINPMMGGFYNMMQGANTNPYAMQELQKQQNDYAKQQIVKPTSDK